MTRPRAALSGAAADQFEIELCQPVEHGQHQTPVRGRSVGHASARDRNLACFFSVDRRERVQQIAGRASRVTNHHVAGADLPICLSNRGSCSPSVLALLATSPLTR